MITVYKLPRKFEEGKDVSHHSVKLHSPSKTSNIFSHIPSFLDAQPSNCLLVHIPGDFYGVHEKGRLCLHVFTKIYPWIEGDCTDNQSSEL